MTTVALNSSKGRWVMIVTIMASSMAFIDRTALNVALPSLQKNLNATGAELFWILNAYLLMLASLMLIGGSLGDKIGRKRIFMTGIFIFIIGSALCGISQTVEALIIFRLIQGIGGALMIPGSLSLISSSINDNERGKAIGTWSAVTTLVTVGGPILGGAFADAGLWRYIFFINAPIGILALIILGTKVQEIVDTDSDKSIDFKGAFAIALGLATFTFGFLSMPAKGIANWQVYDSLLGGIMLLILFVFIEKRSKYPMMPLSIFRNMNFSGTNLLTLFLYAGLGGGMLFLSLNLVQAQGYSQFQSGLTLLPFTFLMIVFSRLTGKLSDKYGARIFLIIGPSIAGIGMLLLAFIKQAHGASDYFSTYFPGVLVFGLGIAVTVVPLTNIVMSSVNSNLSGTASGINNAVSQISGVFANAIFGAMAVIFFSGDLQKHLDTTNISAREKQLVMSQAVNLGDAKVPQEIPDLNKGEIQQDYHESFIASYQKIMIFSSVLCFIGTIMSVLFIRKRAVFQPR